jgi:hypothetical protein
LYGDVWFHTVKLLGKKNMARRQRRSFEEQLAFRLHHLSKFVNYSVRDVLNSFPPPIEEAGEVNTILAKLLKPHMNKTLAGFIWWYANLEKDDETSEVFEISLVPFNPFKAMYSVAENASK